jgi:hypothetical protein
VFSAKNRLKPRLSQNLLTFSSLVRRRGFSDFGKKAQMDFRAFKGILQLKHATEGKHV